MGIVVVDMGAVGRVVAGMVAVVEGMVMTQVMGREDMVVIMVEVMVGMVGVVVVVTGAVVPGMEVVVVDMEEVAAMGEGVVMEVVAVMVEEVVMEVVVVMEGVVTVKEVVDMAVMVGVDIAAEVVTAIMMMVMVAAVVVMVEVVVMVVDMVATILVAMTMVASNMVVKSMDNIMAMVNTKEQANIMAVKSGTEKRKTAVVGRRARMGITEVSVMPRTIVASGQVPRTNTSTRGSALRPIHMAAMGGTKRRPMVTCQAKAGSRVADRENMDRNTMANTMNSSNHISHITVQMLATRNMKGIISPGLRFSQL